MATIPTNDQIVEFNRVALIAPLLVDVNGIKLNWDTAVRDFEATSMWEDLDKGLPFGTFIIRTDGRLEFTPSASGIFIIKCIVTYREPETGLRNIVHGLLIVTVPVSLISPVTVQFTPFRVNISLLPENRLTTDGLGALYVPEVTEDLVLAYSNATN